MEISSFLIGYQAGKNSVASAGVDPYYQQLAEALLLKHAEYVTGDEKTLVMKGFVTTDGNTLGTVGSYAFAGFSEVEYMALSDTVIVMDNAFVGNSALKILDITASSVFDSVGFYPNALTGCTALEAIVVRDGGIGLATVNITNTGCGNDTFYVYVPSEYYDTIIANIPSSGVPSSRFRKLEDYPAIDHYNDSYTVNFYDGDTLVDTKVVKYGGAATTTYAKEGYKLTWEPSNTNITQNTDCYAKWILDVPFDTGSWDGIRSVLEEGVATELWAVGDTRTIPVITYSGTTINVDFEIRAISSNRVTLVSKRVFAFTMWGELSYMTLNTSDENHWGCTGRIRDAYNTVIYNSLPEGMLGLIADVYNVYKVNTSTTGGVSMSTKASTDKIWIPSNDQIYSLFSTSASRIKYEQTETSVGSSAVQYATRDMRQVAYIRPAYVTTSGVVDTTSTGSPYTVNKAPIAMTLKVT